MRDEERDLGGLEAVVYRDERRSPVGVVVDVDGIVVACDDGTVFVWDAVAWKALPPIPGTLADR